MKKVKDSSKKTLQFIICVLIFVLLFCFCSIVETTYTRDVTIIQVDDSLVIAKDLDDQVWRFYGHGYFIGQEVTLVMNTNHTNSNIKDDLIEQVLTK